MKRSSRDFVESPARRRRFVSAASVMMLACAGAGCDPGGGSGGMGNIFAPKSSGSRETWTIECGVFSGRDGPATADKLASLLKKVDGIDPNLVTVHHDEQGARLYYGAYDLRYKEAEVSGANQTKGDLVIELNDKIKRDQRFIQRLAILDQYPFIAARAVPRPAPFKAHPEWDLRNANGLYTLNVGVTYNTASLHDYREAAVLWVEDLRKRGYEAYYYFDPQKPQASICVGTFGEEAFTVDPQGRKGYSRAVQDLRNKEEFQYNLENGYQVKHRTKNPDTKRIEEIPNLSFLAKIPKRADVEGTSRF